MIDSTNNIAFIIYQIIARLAWTACSIITANQTIFYQLKAILYTTPTSTGESRNTITLSTSGRCSTGYAIINRANTQGTYSVFWNKTWWASIAKWRDCAYLASSISTNQWTFSPSSIHRVPTLASCARRWEIAELAVRHVTIQHAGALGRWVSISILAFGAAGGSSATAAEGIITDQYTLITALG